MFEAGLPGSAICRLSPVVENFDHEGGGIILARSLHGGVDETLGRCLEGLGGIGGAQTLEDLSVIKTFRDSVGAEQKNVARLVTHRTHLGIDELIIRAERLLEPVALGVIAGFALVELAVALQPADIGVVV